MSTVAEQECVIVMNRRDAEDGKGFMVSSTWPTWTRFLDQLVKAGLAEIEHEIIRDGRREGANYLVRADAVSVVRKRRVTITPETRAQMAERGRALVRNTRSSPKVTTPSRAPRTSPPTEGPEAKGDVGP
jgi:hypothetical protein